jgi:hypothetical protein
MKEWWRKFNAWQERRNRTYLLERWERIRTKGKTYFVIRESLIRSLILSISLGVMYWYREYKLSLSTFTDVLLYWGFFLVFAFFTNLLFAHLEWSSTEKQYYRLKEQQNLGANKI